MKLSRKTLTKLAEMICGRSGGVTGFDWENFPYRSSTYLTEFFANCDMEYLHDGSTRKWWVNDVLQELNPGPATIPGLPSDGLVRVIQELTDSSYFQEAQLDIEIALADLNAVLVRDGLEAYLDHAGMCHLRNLGTQSTSASVHVQRRKWTPEEQRRRQQVLNYLERASEDEFIENILVPMFSQLGFVRISVAGHMDRLLEYGKDLWMKYQLPTQHYLYFGVQAKRGKIDAAGRSRNENIAEVLAQVRMMLAHPDLR